MLEPETARNLRDKCMDFTFDSTFVVYIATANRLSTIDASLVSRFELFHVEQPGPREAVSIARAIGRQVLHELKLKRRFEAPTGEVVQQMAMLGSPRPYAQGVGRGGRPSRARPTHALAGGRPDGRAGAGPRCRRSSSCALICATY